MRSAIPTRQVYAFAVVQKILSQETCARLKGRLPPRFFMHGLQMGIRGNDGCGIAFCAGDRTTRRDPFAVAVSRRDCASSNPCRIYYRTSRALCNEPCRVQAYYLPGEGIFIDETLNVATDGFARSILLHELVHHHQRMNGRYLQIAIRMRSLVQSRARGI